MVFGHEGSGASRYPELSIPEMDVELDGDTSIYRRITEFVALLGYTPEQITRMLYRGCERSDVDDTNGLFTYERYDITAGGAVWAFTDWEFRTSAEQDTYSSGGTETPLYYALKGTDTPALVVFDGDMLEPVPDSPLQYVPRTGAKLEDSVVAIISITH